jgi:hypothetical protein
VCARPPWLAQIETKSDAYWRRFVEWFFWKSPTFSWTLLHAGHARHDEIVTMTIADVEEKQRACIQYQCGAEVTLQLESHTVSYNRFFSRKRQKKAPTISRVCSYVTRACSDPSHMGHRKKHEARRTELRFVCASFQNIVHNRPRVYVGSYGMLSADINKSWLFFED